MASELAFHILFWILFGGVLLMRIYFILRARRTEERVLPDQKAIGYEGKIRFAFRLASWFLMMAILVSYALNLPWLETFNMTLPDRLRWAGFALGFISILFWTWTQIALGQEWSAQLRLREEHHLITSGPYAHIRHPMSRAISDFGLGPVLVSANWIFVALAVVFIAGLLVRIPREEQMMIGEFGDQYPVYMQRTGRLLPG